MSSKTRTHKTRTTATTARTLRPVSNQSTTTPIRTDTEDKLWAALHADPNSTATDLSVAAKIGKSTAQKILAKWANDGSAIRTPGIAEGGRRAADVWAIAKTDIPHGSTATNMTPTDERTIEDIVPADTAQDEPTTTTPAEKTQTDTASATPANETPAEPIDAKPIADPASSDAQETIDATDDAMPAKAGPADAEPASTKATNPADDPTPSASNDAKDGKTERLAPGALRGMVEDHLHDHPGSQFSPVEIARALGGRSTGAVSNALDKLAEDGVAAKTQDKPRRFALAPAEQAAAAAPAH